MKKVHYVAVPSAQIDRSSKTQDDGKWLGMLWLWEFSHRGHSRAQQHL